MVLAKAWLGWWGASHFLAGPKSPSTNPKGIPAQSPGSRGTSHPGLIVGRKSQPQRGLQQTGFASLPFLALAVQAFTDENTGTLSWSSRAGPTYQVEYSPDLTSWFASPTG